MTRTARRAVVSLLSVVATLVVVPAAPVQAAPVPYSATPLAGWSVDGTVYAILNVGNTVYVGGQFSQAYGPGGAPTVARSNLAAFDGTTGDLISTFTANTNGVVRALATDGTNLFVGGSFPNINGLFRPRLAAVDLATGTVNKAFNPNPNGNVASLAVLGQRLFVGGAFTTINGAARNYLASVDRSTGVVDAFNPNPNNKLRSLVASPDGTRLYIAGDFSAVGGVTRTGLAVLSATTGALLTPAFGNTYKPTLDLDVSADGSRLYGAVGGGGNQAAAWNTTTGARVWRVTADGDVQGLDLVGGNVYFGFHDGYRGDTNIKLLAADAGTGAVEPSFQPTISDFWGVYAVDGTADRVVVGGDFTGIAGRPQRGFAIFRAGSTTTDTTAPTPPSGVNATSVTSSRIDLTWTASTDDVGVVGYDVYRDAAKIGEVSGTTFSDAGVLPSSTYDYTVRARDAAGNQSEASAPLTVTTPAAAGTFSDGFESGPPAWGPGKPWPTGAGFTVQGSDVRSGAWAASGVTTDGKTWVARPVSPSSTVVTFQTAFKINSQTTTMNLLRFQVSGSAGNILTVFVSSGGFLAMQNHVSTVTTQSGTPVDTGVWHVVRARIEVNGTSSTIDVSLDGVRTGGLSGTFNLGTNACGRVILGDNVGGRTYDVVFDDAVISTS